MIQQVFPFIKNVRGSLKTTITGGVIGLFSLVLMGISFLSDKPVTLDTATDIIMEGTLFSIGLILFFLNDVPKHKRKTKGEVDDED